MAIRSFATAVLIVLLAIGCTPAQQNRILKNERNLQQLQDKVLRLERAAAESVGPAHTEPVRDEAMGARLADLGEQVRALADKVRAMEGSIESLERSGESATGNATGSVDSERLSRLEVELSNLKDQLTLNKAASQSVKPAPPPPTPAPSPKPAQTEKELYDAAYASFKAGDYANSQTMFRDFGKRFPKSELSDNALFWIGEAYYAQGKYEKAILEYDKVIQRYPKAAKVPSALLKQAFAFEAIGYSVDAKILFKKLVREHPASEQAAIAKRKLDSLDN